MYEVNEMVNVYYKNELYFREVTIVWASDDGERLELEDRLTGNIFQDVNVEDVFYSHELEKASGLLLDGYVYEVDEVDEDSIIIQDINVSAIHEAIAYNMNNLDELKQYTDQIANYYGTMQIVKHEDTYYLIQL